MSSFPARVLVAADGSVASLGAVRVALELVRSSGAELRVIAVAEAESRAGRLIDDGSAPLFQPRESQLQDVLDHVRRMGERAGVEIETALESGAGTQPYEVILREADRWRADVLVLGRRSHKGLGRALLGSQAEHVLEFASLPVVVVPESRSPDA